MSHINPIKICILFNSMRRGAVTNLYLSLLKHADFKRFKYEIYVLEPAEFSMKCEFEKIGIQVEEPIVKKLLLYRFMSFIRWLNTQKPVIVHSHLSKANFFGPIAVGLSGIRIGIVTHHTVKTGYSLPIKIAIRFANRYCSAKTFVSQAVKQSFNNWKKSKIERVIYNGVDIKEINSKIQSSLSNSIREEYNLNDKFIIAMVGRLIPEKNHKLTLQILKIVSSKIKNVHLIIVGTGPMEEEIKTMVNHMNLNAIVNFTGFRSDVVEIISKSDVVLIPSLREGFSLTMLESMAAGTTFIGSSLPQNKECITSGYDGILIETEHIENFILVLQELFENRQHQKTLVNNAKKRVKDFSVENIQSQYETLYNQCLNNLQ